MSGECRLHAAGDALVNVFDAHIHVQPWEMVKPDVLAMIDDASHQDAKHILSSPDALLRHFDRPSVTPS